MEQFLNFSNPLAGMPNGVITHIRVGHGATVFKKSGKRDTVRQNVDGYTLIAPQVLTEITNPEGGYNNILLKGGKISDVPEYVAHRTSAKLLPIILSTGLVETGHKGARGDNSGKGEIFFHRARNQGDTVAGTVVGDLAINADKFYASKPWRLKRLRLHLVRIVFLSLS